MIALRIFFPWTLLTASLTANVFLWLHNTPPSPRPPAAATPDSPAPSPRPLSSSAVNSDSAAASSPQSSSTLHPPPLTLTSTASRSSAFRGYADLLAEDLKTSEQLASLNDLLARWVATAPTDAAAWLATHDDALFYDPAARHIAFHLVARQNFPEAAIWADLIRDPALREEARDALIAESYRAKKIDAQAVRLSGLTPAHIEAILNGSRLD